MKRFIDEREVSRMTGIAVQTLRNWRHTRQGFPYVKIGQRAIRYDESEVIEFMDRRKIQPEAVTD